VNWGRRNVGKAKWAGGTSRDFTPQKSEKGRGRDTTRRKKNFKTEKGKMQQRKQREIDT